MKIGGLKKFIKSSGKGQTESSPAEGGPTRLDIPPPGPATDGNGQPAFSLGDVSDGAALGAPASPPEAPADLLSVGPGSSLGAAPDTTVSPVDAATDSLGLGDTDSSTDDLMGLFDEEATDNQALADLSGFLEDVDIHTLVEEAHQILAGLQQRDSREDVDFAEPAQGTN